MKNKKILVSLGIFTVFSFLILSGCTNIINDDRNNNDYVCTKEYRPICGEIEVQCIKAPCDPVQQTFPNKCMLEKNKAIFLYNGECKDKIKSSNIPYYFIAIHNEALPDPLYPEITLEKSYITLKEIITKADSYNIKLTLMFNPQWVDYIESNSSRLEDLQSWKQNGHEIAAHHHSIKHPNWNGYTNMPKNEAIVLREKSRKDHVSEEYLGTMDDYVNKLHEINPSINSGCVGKFIDMPDNFIYDTCSGVGNVGYPGQKLLDEDTKKGINEYISSFMVNGIERKYLAHAQITTEEALSEAKEIIESMGPTEVYGAVAHSIKNNPATDQGDAIYILEYLDFLHEKDPQTFKSKTISEIIENKLLPIKKISENSNDNSIGKCGDGICDTVERNNPQICQQDCN